VAEERPWRLRRSRRRGLPGSGHPGGRRDHLRADRHPYRCPTAVS